MNKEECEKALETIGEWTLWDSERTESRRRTNRMKKIIALLVMVVALLQGSIFLKQRGIVLLKPTPKQGDWN